MKTTVDIPDEVLKELIKNSKTKVKKDAILCAVQEFNQRRKLERLATQLGTFADLISKQELLRLRKGSR